MKNKKLLKDGFTFVETLAVLAVTAILAAGAGVSTIKIIDYAKNVHAKTQIAEYKIALESYYADCGRFPTSQQGLEALWTKPKIAPVPEKWNGPYVDKEIQRDPWGNEFVYYSQKSFYFPEDAPKDLPFVLMSYGADGEKNGTGNGDDIKSWM